MKLEINGHTVEVDDSFGQLSQADQQKTVNEIAGSLGGTTDLADTTPPSLGEMASPQMAATAARPALNAAAGGLKTAYDVATKGKIGGMIDLAKTPWNSSMQGLEAIAERSGLANKTLPQALGSAFGGATQAEGPASAFMLPYQMAAYEQAKIRANPNAPEYANNPYAQSLRSQNTANPITQGQAAQQNMQQRSQLGGMTSPANPAPGTPQFAALQQQYAPVRQAMQPQMPPPPTSLAAPPTSANFIGRMHQLADQYMPLRMSLNKQSQQ